MGNDKRLSTVAEVLAHIEGSEPGILQVLFDVARREGHVETDSLWKPLQGEVFSRELEDGNGDAFTVRLGPDGWVLLITRNLAFRRAELLRFIRVLEGMASVMPDDTGNSS